jgi:homoserine O-acetyltransferase
MRLCLLLACALLTACTSAAVTPPQPSTAAVPAATQPAQAARSVFPFVHGDFTLPAFRFATGDTLDLRLHYRTLGTLQKDARGNATNAILILHGTTGTGAQFEAAYFANELFPPGQPFDTGKYFLIFPDGIGHGGSSKPSDGLHARFPRYGYEDMVRAQHDLLTRGLGVNHLRLVFGTSMGGMHTWLWGERYPDFMDALMPMGSVPEQISGRNRAWRRLIIDAIRNDPQWRNGDYTRQPPALRTAATMMYLMAENPIRRYNAAPTLAQADAALDAYIATFLTRNDANDVLYAFEASRDYDPAPGLEKITAPLLAINTFDDLINPGELGILERQITRVPHGRALNLPLSPQTRGHGSHTYAAIWKQYLVDFLKETERPAR